MYCTLNVIATEKSQVSHLPLGNQSSHCQKLLLGTYKDYESIHTVNL